MKIPLLLAAAAALITIPANAQGLKATPSSAHQPVKVEVQNRDPANFTINLKKIANLGVDQKARTFALYTTSSVPDRCGDFRKLDIDYKKPDKYHRVFNLSGNPEVLKALDQYGCVVIPNKPKLPPAKS